MKLQDKFIILGKWSCLAQCYLMKALLDEASEEEKTNTDFLEVAMTSALIMAFNDKTILDDECTVLNPVKLMTGVSERKYNVTKKDITSLDDLGGKWAVVRFDYNGNGHWVLFHGKEMVYNSLENSNCFKYGKMTTARIIEEIQ